MSAELVRGDSSNFLVTPEIRRQQAMEQLLPCLAAHRKASGAIRSRFQPALHIFANAQILFLHAISHIYRLLVVIAAHFADIGEVKIENHVAVIHIDGNHKIRVHVSRVAVDHEIGMLPEIPGTVAFAG